MSDNKSTGDETKFTDMTCSKCGASLHLDLDSMQAVCTHCGSSQLVDTDKFNDVLIEKEKTKRLQMELEQQARTREMGYEQQARGQQTGNADQKKAAGCFLAIFIITLIGFVLLGLYLVLYRFLGWGIGI
jgi:DNA-directed RNA polymerase subunit M/transcription elongation factor TFIIS